MGDPLHVSLYPLLPTFIIFTIISFCLFLVFSPACMKDIGQLENDCFHSLQPIS